MVDIFSDLNRPMQKAAEAVARTVQQGLAEQETKAGHVSGPPTADAIDDNAMLPVSKLVEAFRLPTDAAPALTKRLVRFRKHSDGWLESADAGPRGERFYYRVGAVRLIINAVQKKYGASH